MHEGALEITVAVHFRLAGLWGRGEEGHIVLVEQHISWKYINQLRKHMNYNYLCKNQTEMEKRDKILIINLIINNFILAVTVAFYL